MRRRTSLTATFAVVSLAAMGLLGVVLTLVVSQMLQQQALDQAIRTATAYADAGVRDRVGEQEWEEEQLKGNTRGRLDVNVHPDQTLVEIRLWGKSGKAMYDSVDMAQMARFAMEFCAIESCGKCTPCRIGSTRGVEVIDRIVAGTEREQNIVLLRDLCDTMVHGSLCAMGGMTPYPVLSALDHYPQDFGLAVADRQAA